MLFFPSFECAIGTRSAVTIRQSNKSSVDTIFLDTVWYVLMPFYLHSSILFFQSLSYACTDLVYSKHFATCIAALSQQEWSQQTQEEQQIPAGRIRLWLGPGLGPVHDSLTRLELSVELRTKRRANEIYMSGWLELTVDSMWQYSREYIVCRGD